MTWSGGCIPAWRLWRGRGPYKTRESVVIADRTRRVPRVRRRSPKGYPGRRDTQKLMTRPNGGARNRRNSTEYEVSCVPRLEALFSTSRVRNCR